MGRESKPGPDEERQAEGSLDELQGDGRSRNAEGFHGHRGHHSSTSSHRALLCPRRTISQIACPDALTAPVDREVFFSKRLNLMLDTQWRLQKVARSEGFGTLQR